MVHVAGTKKDIMQTNICIKHVYTNVVKRILFTTRQRCYGNLTLNVRGPSYLGSSRSISWLLMPWLLTSPGHQQLWASVLSTCVKSMLENDIKCKYMFMFPQKNLARKWLMVGAHYKYLFTQLWVTMRYDFFLGNCVHCEENDFYHSVS